MSYEQWKEEKDNKIKKIKEYVNELQKQNPSKEIGIIYTLFEEDVLKNNTFRIFIDDGCSVIFQTININEVL